MQDNTNSRREFIKEALGAGLLVTGSELLSSCSVLQMAGISSCYNDKGLPTAILGKTGVRIPRIVLGLGSRFCNIEKAEDAHNMLYYALDNGLYYWDTAWIYENKKLGIISEERLGEVVKKRRKEIFLSTKVSARNPDEAMRQIETSLKRLQTDRLDMLKIHSVESLEDVEQMGKKGNLIDIVKKMKDQGITRFIGFSGHGNAEAMMAMAERGDFDSMLIAMNHWNKKNNPQSRQEMAIPAAKGKGLGVLLMKVVRPRETVKSLSPVDLVRYALSLNGPDGLVLGMDSLEVLKSNLEILRTFKPMDETKMKQIAMLLHPFYHHENLPWMNSGYCDGNWG
jgi:predicted aldo/keto reductase-like oxidoreductase